MKKFDRNNFWSKSQGVFAISAQGTFTSLIEMYVNAYHDREGFEIVFNKSGNTCYIRMNKFSIRISNEWGNVGDCLWNLDHEADESKYQAAIIIYDSLSEFQL